MERVGQSEGSRCHGCLLDDGVAETILLRWRVPLEFEMAGEARPDWVL